MKTGKTKAPRRVVAHCWYKPGHTGKYSIKISNWRDGDVGSKPGRAREEAWLLSKGCLVQRAYAE
jgi:hypothetical protein